MWPTASSSYTTAPSTELGLTVLEPWVARSRPQTGCLARPGKGGGVGIRLGESGPQLTWGNT